MRQRSWEPMTGKIETSQRLGLVLMLYSVAAYHHSGVTVMSP